MTGIAQWPQRASVVWPERIEGAHEPFEVIRPVNSETNPFSGLRTDELLQVLGQADEQIKFQLLLF